MMWLKFLPSLRSKFSSHLQDLPLFNEIRFPSYKSFLSLLRIFFIKKQIASLPSKFKETKWQKNRKKKRKKIRKGKKLKTRKKYSKVWLKTIPFLPQKKFIHLTKITSWNSVAISFIILITIIRVHSFYSLIFMRRFDFGIVQISNFILC